MTMIRFLTEQALLDLSQEKEASEAQEFLIDQFPELSPEEVQVMLQPSSPERQKAVRKIVTEMHDRVSESRVGELERFLQRWFPFLSQEERREIIIGLGREIPPPPIEEEENAPVYTLVDDALEILAMEQGEGVVRDFLERFSTLSADEVELLAQPEEPGRYQGVVKVVRALEQKAQELTIGEMRELIAEKLPSLGTGGRERLIAELASDISHGDRPKYRSLDLEV